MWTYLVSHAVSLGLFALFLTGWIGGWFVRGIFTNECPISEMRDYD